VAAGDKRIQEFLESKDLELRGEKFATKTKSKREALNFDGGSNLQHGCREAFFGAPDYLRREDWERIYPRPVRKRGMRGRRRPSGPEKGKAL